MRQGQLHIRFGASLLLAFAAAMPGSAAAAAPSATIERDCPELLARCRADRADAAILVAN